MSGLDDINVKFLNLYTHTHTHIYIYILSSGNLLPIEFP